MEKMPYTRSADAKQDGGKRCDAKARSPWIAVTILLFASIA
jgi:hypothetical protein